jgi:hypothetical protein
MYFQPKRDKRTALTPADVYDIRARVAAGEPRINIAQYYGISKQAVDKIHWRHTFAHLPENPADLTDAGIPVTITKKQQEEAEASLKRLLQRGVPAVGIKAEDAPQEPKAKPEPPAKNPYY